jgi:asparagine synthase (glutamine-hydrolysing)
VPGIAGIIGLNKQVDILRGDFQSMLSTLQESRKPLTKILTAKNYVFGVTNIDDGRDKADYYSTRDCTVECLVDGDVFFDDAMRDVCINEFQISHNDHWKEYLPYLYRIYGINFTKFIKGYFNIIVIDRENSSIHLVNDRFGMRALYYCRVHGYIIFSSGLNSILRCTLVDRRINERAICQYFLFNYALGNLTFIHDVFLLDPASYIVVKDDRLISGSYWNHENLLCDRILSVNDSLEGAEYFLRRSVGTVCRDTKRIGLSLTGGFDSRTILALVDNEKVDLSLYSFGNLMSEYQ